MSLEGCQYVGVDWGNGQWIAIGLRDDEAITADGYDSMDDIWTTTEATVERIVVDIPIGLCDPVDDAGACCMVEPDGDLSRRCDSLARDIIGPRSSSVFPAPCRRAARMAADGAPHVEVSEVNEAQTGKGLTVQAKNIAPAIVDVEECVVNADASDVILEAHPEVCFRAFAEADLQHNKTTAAGAVERLDLLETATDYSAGDWRSVVSTLAGAGAEPDIDDVLDALALVYTAAAPANEWQTLPGTPPTDRESLPMQMVYRRSEPFAV